MKKYEQAVAWMEDKIEREDMHAGDKMPGEMAMAKALGFSRQTIRQAVGVLERRGILTSRQGSGIYVAAQVCRQEERQLPFPGKRFGQAAIISTYLDDYIFPGTVRGMQSVLSEHGYATRIELTNNSVAAERSILERILEANEIDGMIVEAVKSALPNPNLDYYRQLRKKGVRIVFFNSFYPELPFPCVRIDDEQCARDAVKLLLSAGRSRIAGIFKSGDGQGLLRYRGYLEALMEECGFSEERIVWIPPDSYRKFDEIEDMVFSHLTSADGVFCYNDELACSLVESALRHGRRVPDDLSVVSIDDSYLAQMTSVPVASFAHPKELLGRRAAEKLIRMVEENAKEEDLIIPVEPVIRESLKR